jgi:sulfate transport system ATP-binding protein
VFDFIGDSSAVPVVVDKGRVRLEDRVLSIDASGHGDGPATLFFRPNHVRLVSQERSALIGVVSGSRRVGDMRRLEVEIGRARHRIEIDVAAGFEIARAGRIAVQPTEWRIFPAPT